MKKKKIKMNYKIVGKYIKDLRFEIPNPKTFFLLEKNISNYKINIDIKSKQFKDNMEWKSYLEDFTNKLDNPIQIKY